MSAFGFRHCLGEKPTCFRSLFTFLLGSCGENGQHRRINHPPGRWPHWIALLFRLEPANCHQTLHNVEKFTSTLRGPERAVCLDYIAQRNPRTASSQDKAGDPSGMPCLGGREHDCFGSKHMG